MLHGILLIGAVTAAGAGAAEAFRNAEVGQTLEEVTLPTLAGGRAPLIDTEVAASVFVFVRPGQEHSRKALEQLTACQAALADRSIRWAAVVSDRHEEPAIEALLEGTGFRGPILLDPGDATYGALGVSLHPAAGIADGELVLRAYQAYDDLRFGTLLAAHVRQVIGDLTDSELEAIVHPPRAETVEADAAAQRKARFASMLLERGKLERALAQARAAVAAGPDVADAHAVLGQVLAAEGDCAAALEAFARALTLAPAHDAAIRGRAACQPGS